MTGARPREGSSSSISSRLAGERPPEGEHLLLTAGEQPGATIGEVGERREVPVGGLGVESLAERGEPEVLGDGEPEEEAAPFGHVGDAEASPGVGRASGQIVAGEADRAGERAHDARDRSQRGGLPGAVRAEEGDHLAGSDVEVEVAEHRGAVVAGREALDGEHRLVAHRPAAGWEGAAASAWASRSAAPR